MSKIKHCIAIIMGLLILSGLVAFTRANPTSSPAVQVGAFPRGAIIAWNAKSGAVPAGWAICDGTNGTPDLRRRFLMGVATLADVGQTPGQAGHFHTVSGERVLPAANLMAGALMRVLIVSAHHQLPGSITAIPLQR